MLSICHPDAELFTLRSVPGFRVCPRIRDFASDPDFCAGFPRWPAELRVALASVFQHAQFGFQYGIVLRFDIPSYWYWCVVPSGRVIHGILR